MKHKNLQTSDILLLPETAPEHGLGHLVRMLRLHDDLLRAKLSTGVTAVGHIVVAVHAQNMMRPELEALLATRGLTRQAVLPEIPERATLQLCSVTAAPYSFSVVVIDQRTIEQQFLRALISGVSAPTTLTPAPSEHPQHLNPTVLGLDAVGSGAKLCDYVLDGFPRLLGACGNETDPGFVLSRSQLTPSNRGRGATRGTDAPVRVLISFGAQGHSTSEHVLLRELNKIEPDPTRLELHLLSGESGESGNTTTAPRGHTVHRRHFDPGAARSYAEFDLVCTHFGMTAYEAAAEGCAVLLLNPSSYHDRLSRRAGFLVLPRHGFTPGLRQRRLTKMLAQLRSGENDDIPKPVISTTRSTSDVVLQICEARSHRSSPDLKLSGSCPVCESRNATVVQRTYGKTYLRCHDCCMLYMRRAFAHTIRYTTEYFFEEYRKQYGKSYLEDFEHIKSMGVGRYRHIQRLLELSQASRVLQLLDIGCAYGPFMAAVAENGGDAYGVDVAEDAVRYVNTELGLRAMAVSLQELDAHSAFGVSQFDAVTLWYVIEHFEQLKPVLHRLSELVRPGGILAFSTPNGAGVSARRSTAEFLRNSPDDHYSIWEPARTAGILARFGFRLEYCVVTGHHPERFPLPRVLLDLPGVHRLLTALSRAIGLGDTFEVYARRVEEHATDA